MPKKKDGLVPLEAVISLRIVVPFEHEARHEDPVKEAVMRVQAAKHTEKNIVASLKKALADQGKVIDVLVEEVREA
jgi:hypothetical protein